LKNGVSMSDNLHTYLPQDRRRALARGESLPDRTNGAALLADISGFTPLTQALVRLLGPRQGAEVLTHRLESVYTALIAEVDRAGGSVIGFAGDAVTCWFDAADGRAEQRAVTCALAMQQAIVGLATIPLPDRTNATLALKTAVSSGPARRFVVGDPAIQRLDTLAGDTISRTAVAEHLAAPGELIVDSATATALQAMLLRLEWREDGETGERFAAVQAVTQTNEYAIPPVTAQPISPEQCREWLLPAVYERELSGYGAFLTELRPTVALFLRFIGIDYEQDEAGTQLDTFICQVQTIINRYEGVLLQLTIGDKGSYLYAAFGAPVAHEDDARRAVEAALELKRAADGLASLQPVQIGISRGTMRTGAYGGTTRLTYGVLGDDANLAARLMSNAAPGEILVSKRLQSATAADFAFVAYPAVQFKGKAEPCARFCRCRPAATPRHPPARSQPTPCRWSADRWSYSRLKRSWRWRRKAKAKSSALSPKRVWVNRGWWPRSFAPPARRGLRLWRGVPVGCHQHARTRLGKPSGRHSLMWIPRCPCANSCVILKAKLKIAPLRAWRPCPC
jgi:adenylate cyclase